MAKDGYVSTGEAAKLLSISRSTVSRRFDLGILQGRVNPITGERLILRSSLRAFLQQHDLPVDDTLSARKVILLATGEDNLFACVDGIAAADERLRLLTADLGTDALISCSSDAPDLLILGDGLPDIAPQNIIKSLRRREQHETLRILCCLGTAAPEQSLEWGSDAALTHQEWRNSSLLRARMLALLGIGSHEVEITEYKHRRKWPRFPVDMPARAGLYRLNAPRQHNWGEAVVKDISEGGAFLTNIDFENRAIPAEPFRILLSIDQLPLPKWQAYCQVVRLQGNGSLTAGLQFVRISDTDRRKISALAEVA